VAERFPPPEPHWVGDGFPVRTIFFYQGLGLRISPFLMLDYVGPAEFPPAAEPRGISQHPHKGFETVTILYQGELEHRDSAGNSGTLAPGDVQWMTAGAGIVHEERHSQEFTRRGGILEAAQLWVNLPRPFKNSPPAYQQLTRETIPQVELPGAAGTARIIAGELLGRRGAARTFTPVGLVELEISEGKSVTLPVTENHTGMVLPLRGQIQLEDGKPLGRLELALLERTGDQIQLAAIEDSRLLLLTGEVIDEPTVGLGPFVLNSQQEIKQAYLDYKAGRMGRV
jgi:redox-sensitive bicupin YhaK (pirin superfamily)